MRIVSGKYRGRTLLAFDGDKIRPTADKVRESLFNILQIKVIDCKFLDLFCGTGAMGIEALSRGAEKVVFNDFSRESLTLLKKNLEKVKVEDDYEIVNFDAVTFLKNTNEKFDIIFLDPPYKTELGLKCLPFASNALEDDGIVVLEDEKEWLGEIEGLIPYDKRKYGRVHLTFFKKENK
ncbi:MAG: 16S rRNA (guanine(966)-N(2))-methyltransferase RsmD [Clostridia bacterium]|nr:16S rRNA (guanine(966)-N(2))-methyltransferase RsmD [Clostridia bacterium]